MKKTSYTYPKKIEKIILQGGIGVMPTDTIYGLVGSALSEKAVKKIYKLRKRNKKKPLIILIGSIADLALFDIKPKKETEKILRKIWPKKVSVILPCPNEKFKYLHRGTKTIAFRLPKNAALTNLLKKTGPLAAPSANPEGLKPAETIKEAKKYFGKKISFYAGNKKLNSPPSTLIAIKNQKIKIIRKGAENIKRPD